ncbi:unnamed protein product [marine sediment metagenome]|uniref:Uncharacterized protein n=1 Tax=marine sediment metagenome TaxID=412755 RepID=X0TD57_9ZZZZ
MKMLKIKSCEGKLIRDPADGRRLMKDRVYTMPANNYWKKRLAQNDVELCEEKKEKKFKSKSEEKRIKIQEKSEKKDEHESKGE